MQNTPTVTITRNIPAEPPRFVELFNRLAAKYRSQGVHTVKEWPQNTERGRQAYRESKARDRFLERLDDAKEVLARAEERLSVVPYGTVISFDELLYGKEAN